jgi:F-type H+-transporting ATPase subunit gamma
MANLKEVRVRIASVNSTQQITKAMKMVSASKLRRAQEAIIQMRPFAAKLREIVENLSSGMDSSSGGAFAKVRPVEKVLIIAVTSNRGLCGAFNASVIRTVNRMISENYSRQYAAGNVKVMCIGKKASDFFGKNPKLFYSQHNDIYAHLVYANTSIIAESVMKDFAAGKFDKVEVVYNQFKNAAVQNLIVETLLPIEPPKSSSKSKMVNDYIFEPGKEEIILEILPKAIRTQLHKALLDSHASEHGARMTAMNKATDNAGELIKALKLSYNKARQAAITNEILEIVGGAEALKG